MTTVFKETNYHPLIELISQPFAALLTSNLLNSTHYHIKNALTKLIYDRHFPTINY